MRKINGANQSQPGTRTILCCFVKAAAYSTFFLCRVIKVGECAQILQVKMQCGKAMQLQLLRVHALPLLLGAKTCISAVKVVKMVGGNSLRWAWWAKRNASILLCSWSWRVVNWVITKAGAIAMGRKGTCQVSQSGRDRHSCGWAMYFP